MKLLPAILMFALVLHYNIRKNRIKDIDNINEYMAREAAANETRRRDISDLPYIYVDFESLPLDITLIDSKKQSVIESCQAEFKRLKNVQMLNLTGISNTELKEKYGPANLDKLSACDANFTRYMRNLCKYADAIYEEYPDEAIKISEYCLQNGCDIATMYELLANHYLKEGKRDAFENLYGTIADPESIIGKRLTDRLNACAENQK